MLLFLLPLWALAERFKMFLWWRGHFFLLRNSYNYIPMPKGTGRHIDSIFLIQRVILLFRKCNSITDYSALLPLNPLVTIRAEMDLGLRIILPVWLWCDNFLISTCSLNCWIFTIKIKMLILLNLAKCLVSEQFNYIDEDNKC